MKFDNIKVKVGGAANKVKSKMSMSQKPKSKGWELSVRHNGKDVFSMKTKTAGKIAKTASTVKAKLSPKG